MSNARAILGTFDVQCTENHLHTRVVVGNAASESNRVIRISWFSDVAASLHNKLVIAFLIGYKTHIQTHSRLSSVFTRICSKVVGC